MAKYLLVDVGAGTQDILWFDDEISLHYKAVVKSPVRKVAEKAAALPQGEPLFVSGGEMGGGPITAVLRERAKKSKVWITEKASSTLHHDKSRVCDMGLEIVANDFVPQGDCLQLKLADIDRDELAKVVSSFGVEFKFDVLAFCAQDHGVAPSGQSHLIYRYDTFTEQLRKEPYPHKLLFSHDEIDETWNRLRYMAASGKTLPADEVYVMDSGMAAILGATMDKSLKETKARAVLDVATSHTVGAIFDGDELAGYFEVHTKDLDVAQLDELLPALANGEITHEDVLASGGHGAWCRKSVGFENIKSVVATGPQRRRINSSKLPLFWGAPLGDNMMTGTAGLLEAVRRRKGLGPLSPF